MLPFQPESICVDAVTGRVYHAGPERVGGVGLVRSGIAIEWSKDFVYEADQLTGNEDDSILERPSHFIWQEQRYRLYHQLHEKIRHLSSLPADK